ncbi:MAG: enoyl-CoA hydratase/isomerase family protein [Candidatus Eisenbacteria bacterium]|uniref:Enoyl-CoA hydratase/isomerase family protein n=1 Tax=Eiseniibacteriota bacterium TaxID=2212470 RepID=A0A956LY84_UNCEI|nr:enoyl-CoA hydratase/isomerase family protein [Candidatus Eisenbacteria bacterium]
MKPIETIAVVGAGNMGSGIAQKYAMEGFPVFLLDVDQAAIDRGAATIERMLGEAVDRKILPAEQALQVFNRITTTLDWARLSEADLVIEAVFEDLEVKRKVFAKLAEHTRPECILATNTSSFYVRQVAEVTPHPERVLGLHYFFHPAKNRLVEVIAGPQTPDEQLQRAWTLQEQIGKTPIASADAPGFIVNRFFVPFINEAARLLEQGVADAATIEQAAIEGFRIGLGPFQLMNVTGIAIGYHAAATLERELGAFYAPSGLIHEYMKSGRTFNRDELAATPDRSKFQEIQERLLGVTFHVACELVSEGVGSIEDVDIGARVGLRWARGPFELMNKVGIAEAARISGAVEARYGLETPQLLLEQKAEGTAFPIRLVKMRVDDGIATITFNRPDALNALNPQVADQLEARLDAAAGDPAVHGIVITGTGKAFVAGADIRFFLENMKSGQHARIAEFAVRGHALLKKIEQ